VNGGTKKKRGRPPKKAKTLNETDKSITIDKSNTSVDNVASDKSQTSNNRKGKSKVKNDAVTNLNTSSRGRKRKTLNYSNMDKSGDEDEENNNENEDEDGESRLNDDDSVVTDTTAAEAGGGSDNDTDDYECEKETPVKQKKGQPKPKKGAQIKVWFILIYLGSVLRQVVLTFINHSRLLLSDGVYLIIWTKFVFIFMMSLV